ncbi:MAG: hypothetical protein US74_C0010G0005 [Parcubacteria group bacterium GW2011_GWA2_38_13]|nr:MAG: hypothetical protein US74_C0010G0005 [Parcubacteria group bacterium GW2011_GWA2_38_13]
MEKWIVYLTFKGLCTFAMNMSTGEQNSFPSGTDDLVSSKEIALPIGSDAPIGNTYK